MAVHPHHSWPAATLTTACVFFAALPPVPEHFWNLSWAGKDYLLVNTDTHRLQGRGRTLDARLSGAVRGSQKEKGPEKAAPAWLQGGLCFLCGHASAFNTHPRAGRDSARCWLLSSAFYGPIYHRPLRKLEVDRLLSPQKQSRLPECLTRWKPRCLASWLEQLKAAPGLQYHMLSVLREYAPGTLRPSVLSSFHILFHDGADNSSRAGAVP